MNGSIEERQEEWKIALYEETTYWMKCDVCNKKEEVEVTNQEKNRPPVRPSRPSNVNVTHIHNNYNNNSGPDLLTTVIVADALLDHGHGDCGCSQESTPEFDGGKSGGGGASSSWESDSSSSSNSSYDSGSSCDSGGCDCGGGGCD